MDNTVTVQELETLASFLPERLLRRFAQYPAAFSVPEQEQLEAAVLFADISGFSPLAERLAKLGPAGAEELTAILNRCFDRLIGLIDEQGGDVIKFAGDAVLALWETGKDGLPTATWRAAQCALHVRAALQNYEVGGGTRLSVHSGVGAGTVTIANVGGQMQRWELLVSGPPLIQIGRACKQAGLGEVVVAGHAWEYLRARAQGVKLDHGDWRLESIQAIPLPPSAAPAKLDSAAEAAVRGCIPRAVRTRIGVGQDAWLAELRNLTVLFVNLPDLTETLPLRRAQAVMNAMQSALYRFEGSVNQLGADDKGVTLVAAFGLPPLAHEDDALRGVQAAQAIQARLRELGVRSAIGVTTGRVYCGSVGSVRRRQYAIIGDVVNLAARLMQIAPADILCDTATQRASAAKMRFEPLPPQSIKGKAQPVALFRPYCQAIETSRGRPMFGRQAELSFLMNALEGAQSGCGGVILIEGEAGIGKSRLLAEFIAEANSTGLRVLAGAGDAIERSTSYHAWRPLFVQYFELDSLTTTEERRAHLRVKLANDPAATERAPLLNSVLQLDLSDNDLTVDMTGQVRADNTNDLLLRLLQAACSVQPTTIIIEDTHWLDSASWALILLVCHHIRNALVVLTTRPLIEPLTAELRSFLELPHLRRLRLETLPKCDTTELAESCLGGSTLPRDVAAFIHEKTQGNPFFTEELALALREGGLLAVEDGRCRLAAGVDLRSIGFPDSVQGVITSRIDRLHPSQQLTLKVASVIGRVFALRVLRDIFPIHRERSELPEYLQSLDRLDLTSLETPAPDLAYIFKHVVTQEVAYQLMTFAQRRQLHQAAAEWYERAPVTELAPPYPLLAHHWSHADDKAKALNYMEKAGEQALRGGFYNEAVEFFSNVLRLAQGDESGFNLTTLRRAAWERQLGEAYMGLGQLNPAETHTIAALNDYGFRVPLRPWAVIGSLCFQLLRQIVHRLLPRWTSVKSPVERERFQQAAIAFERIAHISYYHVRLEVCVNAGITSLNLAELGGPSSELACALAGVGFLTATCNLHRAADFYIKRAFEVSNEISDTHGTTWVLEMAGVAYSGLGRWKEALDNLSSGTELTARLGDWRRWEETQAQLATLKLQHGDFEESVKAAEDLQRVTHQRNHGQPHTWALCMQLHPLLRLGRLDAAEEVYTQLLHWPVEAFGLREKLWSAAAQLAAELYLEKFERAAQSAKIVQEIIEKTKTFANFDVEAYCAYATFRLESLEREPSSVAFRREADHACRAVRRCARSLPIAWPRYYLFDGWRCWSGKRYGVARRRWEEGVKIAQRMEMAYDEALIRYHRARLQGNECVSTVTDVELAAGIFDRLGARFDLERARALPN